MNAARSPEPPRDAVDVSSWPMAAIFPDEVAGNESIQFQAKAVQVCFRNGAFSGLGSSQGCCVGFRFDRRHPSRLCTVRSARVCSAKTCTSALPSLNWNCPLWRAKTLSRLQSLSRDVNAKTRCP